MAEPINSDLTPLPRKPGRRKRRGPWEPNALQWAIYEAVAAGKPMREVAESFTAAGRPMTFQNVGRVCKRIDQFLAQQHIDNVREIRARHTAQLEHVFCEAMAAWEKSKEIGVTVETEEIEIKADGGDSIPATKRKRKEVHQCGSPAFLHEARAALAEIRKIHAVDKNPKVTDPDEREDDDRVAGKSRLEVIDEHIQRLQSARKAVQAVTGATSGAGGTGTNDATA